VTETEKLLTEAQDLALRAFESPTQETVMELMRRLCDEADRLRYETPDADDRVLH
jgi:hypothetical protein